jgi:hypothetical protein
VAAGDVQPLMLLALKKAYPDNHNFHVARDGQPLRAGARRVHPVGVVRESA